MRFREWQMAHPLAQTCFENQMFGQTRFCFQKDAGKKTKIRVKRLARILSCPEPVLTPPQPSTLKQHGPKPRQTGNPFVHIRRPGFWQIGERKEPGRQCLKYEHQKTKTNENRTFLLLLGFVFII